MNFWFWLFVVLPPVLVFNVKPEASTWLQATRLILAIALASYTFLKGTMAWQGFWLILDGPHPCNGMFRDPLNMDMCTFFGNIALYANSSSIIAFSSIVAASYVGMNEAIWRMVHRRTIARLDGSHFLSNVLLIYIAPAAIFLIICIVFFASRWLAPETSQTIRPPGVINYWLWNFVVLLPVLVLCVKPEASSWLKVGRLLTAVALGYLLLNAGVHWGSKLSWQAYEACHRLIPNGDQNGVGYEKCKHLLIGTGGANFAFALLLGWIPAGAYAGGWEFLWRIYYRRRIRETADTFGKWVSNILLILSLPVWVYLTVLMAAGLYSIIYPFQPP